MHLVRALANALLIEASAGVLGVVCWELVKRAA
jgi:hypothetical protein